MRDMKMSAVRGDHYLATMQPADYTIAEQHRQAPRTAPAENVMQQLPDPVSL
jgi:hypothetical protein